MLLNILPTDHYCKELAKMLKNSPNLVNHLPAGVRSDRMANSKNPAFLRYDKIDNMCYGIVIEKNSYLLLMSNRFS